MPICGRIVVTIKKKLYYVFNFKLIDSNILRSLQGYEAIFGDAFEMAFSNVLLPAFGNPTRPTSAINFKSTVTVFSSPRCPRNEFPEHPPPPPPAAIQWAASSFRSPIILPPASNIVTPTGTSMRRSTPRRPRSRSFELSSPWPAWIFFVGFLKIDFRT